MGNLVEEPMNGVSVRKCKVKGMKKGNKTVRKQSHAKNKVEAVVG